MQRIRSGANFARYALGDLIVVALRDGYVDMPPIRLRQDGNRPFGSDLPAQVTLVDGKLRLSVNAFLVIEQDRHILIDTGAANAWEPSMGLLLGALAEAGVARESIGTVAFTHTHSDHINGLVAEDESDAFPNLQRLFVPQEEIAAFDRSERLARFRQRRVPFADGFPMSDSITAVHAPGHEVGHKAFEVASGGEALLIWGDIVHVPSIQFARPELTWEFDRDQAQARITRAAMLDRAARSGVFVAGAHLDFPGIGSITRAGDAYRFSPV
jgi:glyoxylase-like metal-dependent hydrolase (beta-lactamase superfamily II)